MLRHLVRYTSRYRLLSWPCTSYCTSAGGFINGQANASSVEKKIKTPSHQTSLKAVTGMPFAEIPTDNKDSEIPTELSEFIDSIGPPLPISFNLASYVNKSESLQKLVQLGVDLSALEQKPEKAKYILQLDFERDIKTHIQFLHDHGVEAELLGKFVTKNPFIFKYSIEDMEVRVNYLKSKKFSNASVSRIIGSNPFFLSLDTKKVDTRLGFFQKQFFLSGNEVRYLITKSPDLVTYDFDKLREKLFCMKEVLGFNATEMKKILLDKPKVWMLSRKNLEERFTNLHNFMGLPHERIVKYPNVLLTRTFIVKQRHLYLVHLKRAQYNPDQPLYVSLQDLVTTPDNVFCEKCAKTSINDFNEFLKTL